MIYLDSAATALHRPPQVEKALINALNTLGNPSRGAHAPALNAARIVYDTREKLSKLLGFSDPARLAFTSNATEALNIAINGIFNTGVHCITTECEHNSVLRPLYYAVKNYGVELTILKSDIEGNISLSDLEKAIKSNTKAIVISHASNLTGNVNEISEISKIAHKNNVLLVVDGAQTAGAFPVDVEKTGIDIFCFTGHKGLMGPQGTGGIYVKEGISLSPLKVGGSGIHSFDKEHPKSMPEALEAGTLNCHGIAVLNASVDFILKTGIENIYKREKELSHYFIEEVRKIKNIRLYGNFNYDRVAVVSLNIGNMPSSAVSDILWRDYEICVRSGAHCAPLLHKALGTEKQGAVRFSFSYYTTEEEINLALKALYQISKDEL